MRATIRLILAAAVVLLLASCRVDATVELDVFEDGTGTVSAEAVFDEAAAQALGGPDGLGDQIFVADLAAAGWAITRPEVNDDGTTVIRASKDVPSPDQFQPVLDELVGPGVFRDVVVANRDEFAERGQSVELLVDLGRGWDLFADAGVTAALEGEPFGVPIEQLTDGRPIDEVIGVQVQVNQIGSDGGGGGAATFRFDEPAREYQVAFIEEQATAVLLRWIAYALASLFVLSLALAITGIWLQRRADRLRPQATPAKLSTRIPGASTASSDRGGRSTSNRAGSAASPAAARAPGPSSVSVRLVIVEPLSVLYQQSESPETYLLPFVRHNDGEGRADEILEAHGELLHGRMSTEEFWDVAGIGGDPAETDAVFAEMRWLRKTVPSFLKELEQRRIPVAALTNDARSWSEAVRERDRLMSVWPWLISSEVGATKPDAAMFEVLRRETGVAYRHCLYIDTDIAALDAARELGMRTALYNEDDLELPALVGHLVVDDLLNLMRGSA